MHAPRLADRPDDSPGANLFALSTSLLTFSLFLTPSLFKNQQEQSHLNSPRMWSCMSIQHLLSRVQWCRAPAPASWSSRGRKGFQLNGCAPPNEESHTFGSVGAGLRIAQAAPKRQSKEGKAQHAPQGDESERQARWHAQRRAADASRRGAVDPIISRGFASCTPEWRERRKR